MKGTCLYAHRRWTELGVYEATFTSTEGGYVIKSAVVTGDETRYSRSSDQDESVFLEMPIDSHPLYELPTASQTAGQSPVVKWELAVPTMLKHSARSFIQPRIIKNKD